MIDEAMQQRHERNLAAFNAVYPAIGALLTGVREPGSRIVGSVADGDINLDLGHTTLYATDAVSFAETQLERHRATPERFFFDPPVRVDPSLHTYYLQDRMTGALYGCASEHRVAALSQSASTQGGYLLVYGIGLGFHLPALFDETDVEQFVLVEEHIEFLHHTLFLHDWVGIFEKLRDRGQGLRIVLGNDPHTVGARVHWQLRADAFGLLDGSYIFHHYNSMLLDKAFAEFKENLPLLPISNGFFEDEWNMLRNGTQNLVYFNFKLLEEKPRTIKDVPAFIIGSGPSLDGSLEIIKNLQDRVIIFSCGTSIRPLLEHGIRPDFHCELENTLATAMHLKAIHENFGGFEGITLLASSTLHPIGSELFDRRIFYFRDSVCSTPLWCPDGVGIHGTAPTCTNVALRASQLLEIREIYFFGVDLGTRDSSQHHSRYSIYHADDEWLEIFNSDATKQFTIEMPANFGGKAYTNAVLHWTRMLMGQTIKVFPGARVFNCSDGVSIEGAVPKLPSSVRLLSDPRRKASTLARIDRELDPKAAHEMVPKEDLDALLHMFEGYYRGLIQDIETAKTEQLNLRDFYRRMAPYFVERPKDRYHTTLRSIHVGTMMMIFQVANYFVRRATPEGQEILMGRFYETLGGEIMDRLLFCIRLYFGEDETAGTGLVPSLTSAALREPVA